MKEGGGTGAAPPTGQQAGQQDHGKARKTNEIAAAADHSGNYAHDKQLFWCQSMADSCGEDRGE